MAFLLLRKTLQVASQPPDFMDNVAKAATPNDSRPKWKALHQDQFELVMGRTKPRNACSSDFFCQCFPCWTFLQQLDCHGCGRGGGNLQLQHCSAWQHLALSWWALLQLCFFWPSQEQIILVEKPCSSCTSCQSTQVGEPQPPPSWHLNILLGRE